jgi:hypothetical protein
MADLLPTEHQEQRAVMQWARLHEHKWPCLVDLFAVPNGGHRNKVTAAALKAEGVKPGIPDLFLPVPVGTAGGLWIEMKRRKGGRLSSAQKGVIQRFRKRNYAVAVCYGAEEAIEVLLGYLNHLEPQA